MKLSLFDCLKSEFVSSFHKILKQKYQNLAERSFKTKLELFLFSLSYKEELLNFTFDDFRKFSIEDSLVSKYETSWNLSGEDHFSVNNRVTIEEIDDGIKKWEIQNSEFKNELLNDYKKHFDGVLGYDELVELFPENPNDRVCYYTGLSDSDLESLRHRKLIYTKRARGRIMEIDRINSNREYSKDNIVLACYWANNAKTDEFTIEEFTDEIGPGIRKIFQNRMRKKFGDPKGF